MRKLLVLGTLFLAAACGDSGSEDSDSEHDEGEAADSATGATCPQGSTLTYQSFAKGFAEAYCVRCHSSTLSGAARMDAPLDHNFDSLEGLKEEADHVDEAAGAGPKAVNTTMPPSGPAPSEDERKKLSEWIACGMP